MVSQSSRKSCCNFDSDMAGCREIAEMSAWRQYCISTIVSAIAFIANACAFINSMGDRADCVASRTVCQGSVSTDGAPLISDRGSSIVAGGGVPEPERQWNSPCHPANPGDSSVPTYPDSGR